MTHECDERTDGQMDRHSKSLQRTLDNMVSEDGSCDETTAKKGHHSGAMTKKIASFLSEK